MPIEMKEQDRPSVVASSALLQAKLQALRRRHLEVALGAGLARVIGAVVLLVGLEMGLDYWLDFSWALRAGLLLAIAASVGTLAFRRIVQPLLHRPDDDALALLVEKRLASFRSRLIAAVQLSRPGGCLPGLRRRWSARSSRRRRTSPDRSSLPPSSPTRELKKFGAWAGLALVVGLVVLASAARMSVIFSGAPFSPILPCPRKTRVGRARGGQEGRAAATGW